MAIPSVMQGLIETEDGKVFQLDSPKGSAWLESIGSFRYEPTGDGKPYTVRKEPNKSGAYWYGCRKVAGKVRKKYIGKSSEVSIAKLEEISEALEIPPVPRADKVAEVAEIAQQVTEIAEDRLTALESQVAELLKAVKDLQEALPGKSEAGDSLELPKVDNEVVERLQNELGNLKAENEKLKADYAALLESSTDVTNKLRNEVREVRSQLVAEEARYKELDDQYEDVEKWWRESEDKVTSRDMIIAELRSELSDLKQKSAAARDLPEAADLLNQLKTSRKKSNASLADVELILEMIDD
ncbi:hypothetical protein QUA20_06590 [Microcoleus sp. Pol7_A1]|uniref:hypothetical protein n=1 Tax=Microcoleus sp. Pol7_A1 TaxID=2818893 RepID=UPI002FD61338